MCVVAAVTIPVIVRSMPVIARSIRSVTAVNPENFEDANVKFFERRAKSRIVIVSPSFKEPVEVEQGTFTITIIPLQRALDRIADQENKKRHANGAVLVFACYELLHGDKELGRKLIMLLKEHDGEIRYNYPTGKKGLLGDAGDNIYIDEFVRAADKFVKDDLSEKDVLEKPASQYEWRKKRYDSTATSE